MRFTFCFSGSSEKTKKAFEEKVSKIGIFPIFQFSLVLTFFTKTGHLIEDHTKATHILMKEVQVTSKLLIGLMHNLPVVNLEFVDCISNLKEGPLPDPKK